MHSLAGLLGVSAPAIIQYILYWRFGWGFLANKAVWHNKSKMKSYGELFRTGDTVTVVLDLDLGEWEDREVGRKGRVSGRGRGGISI